MASEVGSAYVTLVPSARGFAAKMQKELGSDIARAGRNAGDDYSDEFSDQASRGLKGKGKSMFGGIAKVAAGALAGVGIGQFIGDALGEARDAAVVGARTSNVIKSMGGAANISAKQVADLAGKLSNKTAMDDEAIQSGQNLLLTFGNLRNEAGKGNDIFNQTSGLMVDMSAAMGTDVKGSAIQLGKALNDPVKGVSALTRVGVSFTEQQKNQIKRLQESGNMLGAQKVILGEVKKQFGGAGEAMATPAERAKVAWGNFKEDVGTALLPVVDRLLNKLADFLPTASQFASTLAAKVGPAMGKARDAAKAMFDFFKNNQTTLAVVAVAIGAVATAMGAHAVATALSTGAMKKWALQTKVVRTLTAAWAAIQWVLNAALNANPIGLIVIAIAAVVAIVALVIRKLGGWDAVMKKLGKAWEGFKNMMGRVWGAVKGAVSKGVSSVVNFLKGLPGKALGAVKSLGSKLKGFFSGVWNAVKSLTVRLVTGYVNFYLKLPGRLVNALRTVGGKLKDVFTKAWDAARTAVGRGIDKVVAAVRALPGKIAQLGGKLRDTGRDLIDKFVSGLTGAAGLVSDLAGNIWDSVRGLLNDAIDKLNNALEFTINPPGPGSVSVNPPDIGHLATGGRVTGATLAVIGEGREPETVLPDSLLRGLLDRTAANARGTGQVGHLTITNWREGTGYFRMLADESVANETRFRRDLRGMHA